MVRRRRWWIIPACILIGLLSGFAYLAVAKKTYTCRAILAVETPGSLSAAAPSSASFVAAQSETLRSQAILSEAGVEPFRDALNIEAVHGDSLISIWIESENPREASNAINAIVETYLKRRIKNSSSSAAGLAELTVQREQLAAERAAQENALGDYRISSAAAAGAQDGETGSRVNQLKAALEKAKLEAEETEAAVKKSEPLLTDPQALKEIIEANQNTGIFGGLDRVHAQITAEIAQLEAQLTRQKATMSAQHPVVVAMQKKIDLTRAKLADVDRKCADAWRLHLEGNHTSAERKVSELLSLLDRQAKPQADDSTSAAKLATLETNLKSAEAALTDIDAKIRIAAQAKDSTEPIVKVIQPAVIPTRATRPDQEMALLLSSAAGLIAGLLLVLIFPRATA